MKADGIDLTQTPVFDLRKAAGRVIDVRIEGIQHATVVAIGRQGLGAPDRYI